LSAGIDVKELDGFKVDQEVWCVGPGGNIIFGTIIGFYPSNEEGPAVSVLDEISGSFRVALASTLSVDPIKGGPGKLTRARLSRVQKKR
tara:strand:- start:3290 stop:3556 length:267 start_codon:yes stop_codon:yes gene_type:complete